MNGAEPGPLDAAAQALAELRDHGATNVDPVALARLDATVRRGRQQDAAVQQWLAARLAGTLTALQTRVAQHRAEASSGQAAKPAAWHALAPLRTPPAAELRSAQRLRPTLARVRVQRQIARAQARQPDNPGPLNSEHLLVRALQQMQTLAPAYLGPFITQVEALLWLDSARGAGAAPADTPRATARRKKSG